MLYGSTNAVGPLIICKQRMSLRWLSSKHRSLVAHVTKSRSRCKHSPVFVTFNSRVSNSMHSTTMCFCICLRQCLLVGVSLTVRLRRCLLYWSQPNSFWNLVLLVHVILSKTSHCMHTWSILVNSKYFVGAYQIYYYAYLCFPCQCTNAYDVWIAGHWISRATYSDNLWL
jgi:hypothetical protein